MVISTENATSKNATSKKATSKKLHLKRLALKSLILKNIALKRLLMRKLILKRLCLKRVVLKIEYIFTNVTRSSRSSQFYYHGWICIGNTNLIVILHHGKMMYDATTHL